MSFSQDYIDCLYKNEKPWEKRIPVVRKYIIKDLTGLIAQYSDLSKLVEIVKLNITCVNNNIVRISGGALGFPVL